MITLRNVVLIWWTAAFCLLGSVASASPLFDNGASNVWMLDKTSGKIVSSFSLSSGSEVQWTERAQWLTPNSSRITYSSGFQDVGNINLLTQEVLVNQTQNSLPPLNTNLPATTLAGIDLAISSVTNPQVPGMTIDPAPGTYDKTIAVHLHGVTARLSTASLLTIHWRINGGLLQSKTATAGGENIDHTFYLVANSDYQVEFWATQNSLTSLPNPQIATFRIDSTEPLQRDSDGDQIPDMVEAALGLDPLANDYALDSDNDGWSDFFERFLQTDPNNPLSLPAFSPVDSDGDLCSDYVENLLGFDHTDPTDVPVPCNGGLTTQDSDGDGVPDKFEELRGTNHLDPTEYPVARRPFEVEYLVTGSIFQDAGETTKQTSMGELTVHDINWELLYDQAALTGTVKTQADSALNSGDLPPIFRLPAGDQLILRARHLAGVTDKWVVKSWMNSTADIQPRDAALWHENQGNPQWSTSDQWMAALTMYLGEFLVQNKAVSMSPVTGLGVSLVEGIVAWYAALSDGALILLGHDANPTPEDAVSGLRTQLAKAGRNLNSLHSELFSLTNPGKELAGFRTSVAGFYDNPGSIVQSTTTREAAAMVQGGSRDSQVSYISRLLATMTLESINALGPSSRAVLMDPDGDSDNDGLANGNELNKAVGEATFPTNSDSDNDLLTDNFDPCPADSDNLCLWKQHQENDTDGDTIVDAVDNCMHTSNSDQQDSNSDGIGDACAFYANIKSPASDGTIWTGDDVEFTSLVTEHGGGLTLDYKWTFSGAAADSSLANPGQISFNSPGNYVVKLVVENTATHVSLGEDYRTIHVLSTPTYTVSTSAPSAEGNFTPTSRTVISNQTTTFMVNATSGYIIDTVSGCGGLWTGANPFTTGPVTADCTVVATFITLPLGDANGDGFVTLADAITVLQILTGLNPGTGYSDRYLPATDSRWGLEEILFILQEVSGP